MHQILVLILHQSFIWFNSLLSFPYLHFYYVSLGDTYNYKDFQQTEWMLQYKAKGKLGSLVVREQKIICLLVNSIHSSASSQLFLASFGVCSILEIYWHRFKSTGILEIKIKLKNAYKCSSLDHWNVTGRQVGPTNLSTSNFSLTWRD